MGRAMQIELEARQEVEQIEKEKELIDESEIKLEGDQEEVE